MTKRYLFRMFFVGELFLFLIMYLFGSNGIKGVVAMNKKNSDLDIAIVQLRNEIHDLERTIYVWQTNPIKKEKLAREQLQMARPTERIYYLT